MKKYFISLFLIGALGYIPTVLSYVDRVIEDPNIIKVCVDLTDKRKLKIKHTDKLRKVLLKNQTMQSILRPEQQKAKTILQRINDKIVFQIKVSSGRIVDLGEQIIKSGCPPIDLKGQILRTPSTQEIVNRKLEEINIEELDLISIEESPSIHEQ